MSENCDETNVKPDAIRFLSLKNLDRIKLNVGGQKFETSADTLKKHDSFFSKLLASDSPQKVDENFHVLIDRDGKHFEKILNFMRSDEVDFGEDVSVAKEILKEADFYQLRELMEKCNEFLASPRANLAACKRAVYTLEERDFIISTEKPIVFLAMGGLENEFFTNPASHKAIATSFAGFMRLRKKFLHFTFVMDYTPSTTTVISMDFYFDGNLVKRVKLFDAGNNECISNFDIQVSDAANLMSGKMLEKFTGCLTVVEGSSLAIGL